MKTSSPRGQTGPRQTVPEPQARKDRLKAALKANISRRKAQAAARVEAQTGSDATDAER